MLFRSMGADSLTGGLGADVFDYSSFTESSRGTSTQDYIVSWDLGSDKLKLPSRTGGAPYRFWNAGRSVETATSLDAAISSLFADKDRATAGSQAMGEGDVVLFTYGSTTTTRTTYLMAAAGASPSLANDLFIRMGSGLTTLTPATGAPLGEILSSSSNYLLAS